MRAEQAEEEKRGISFWPRWAATAFVVFFVVQSAGAFIGANVQKLAEENHWDTFLRDWWPTMSKLLVADSAVFWFLFGLSIGTAGALWVARLFPESISPKNGANNSLRPPEKIKTRLRLQFFGDERVPVEITSDNIATWFAYFSPSISLTPHDENGNAMPGGFTVPPNWAVFLSIDQPTTYRQVLASFSNPEIMPLTEVRQATGRSIVVCTRGQVPAGVFDIYVDH